MGTAPVITLNSSHKMPLIGFGTAVFPFAEADAVKQAIGAILCGIKNGYRHFDTASVYQTEETLGQAIKQALNLGLIQSRDELFITSKLWCCDSHPELVLPALKQTLQKLQLEYLDLYLIHWPVSSKPGNYEYATPKEEVLPMDFKSVWAGMEECQRLGLSKSIGVSNFSCKKLEEILTTAKITPSVNEVEMNLVWQQNKLGKFCKEKGIIVTAYSPLGAKGTSWGSNKVMDNEALKEIAKTRGKTPAQVCLRWLYEQGVGVVVKSFNEGRMKENLDIFDWELSEEEHELISQIPQSKANTGENFVWAKGPFKSLEEFWDGEI